MISLEIDLAVVLEKRWVVSDTVSLIEVRELSHSHNS